ncbi:MAG: lysophospholipid acyltransferase family protein [Xanthomonadales bacterium]|nr:lysophospholipid acyltransferase family protein [Xanthomonadales bacterium]
MAAPEPRAHSSWPLWPFCPLLWLLARLPQPLLLGLGNLLAWLVWPFAGRRRRIAARNIDLCFPALSADRQQRLLRDNFRATVTGLLEMIRSWFAPSWRLRGLFDAEGLEHIEAARAEGRGILLLSAHFTTVELACRLLNEVIDPPARMLVRRHGWAPLEALVDRGRRAHAVSTLEKKDIGGLLRELKTGNTVLYGGDQDFSSQNVFVPFFGIPASTLATTPRIAARANAVTLPLWCKRKADGRYQLTVGPPWHGYPSGDSLADAARYMAELEAAVREAPAQYLWVHRRFKTRPPGESSLYEDR